MEHVLNQEEIDAMVRAAGSGGPAKSVKPETSAPALLEVKPWDVRLAGRIGREQLQAITLLHEGFARNLTRSLGAYLRVVFAVALVSAEHLTYREFLNNVPEVTYLASCRLEPMDMSAALQLDLKLAFPIIDLLLGGQGTSMTAAREITDIEKQILESVAHIVCREFSTVWQALSLRMDFDQLLGTGEAHRLMPPDEKILSLSFEITMSEVRGSLNLAIPAAVSNAILRKISTEWSYRRPRARVDSRQRLMRLLLDCPFAVELGACDVRAAVSNLAGLAPGTLLSFLRRGTEPASLLVAGIEMFRALPARCGNMRAARILDRCSATGELQAESEEMEP